MTIVKTFLLPKLLYVSSLIETPTDVIKRMEKMIFKFLWKGLDKVTRLSVKNSVKNGGLNLTDLETQIKAIRLSSIPRILDCSREGPWKHGKAMVSIAMLSSNSRLDGITVILPRQWIQTTLILSMMIGAPIGVYLVCLTSIPPTYKILVIGLAVVLEYVCLR